MRTCVTAEEKAIVDEKLFELGFTAQNRVYISFLIQSENDRQDFMDRFWTERSRQMLAIGDYRREKIDKRNLSFDEFISIYEEGRPLGNDNKRFIEELFMLPCGSDNASVINNKIVNEYEIIRRLYDVAKGDKGVNITRAIRRI
ncbi:hypothetical protein MKY96_32610 [Paenibacillus sp. FSL R7-0302]|uniref:hypothetical protein n=1 Tax=Paenibacillus sp. FSL R7-0302 TaxID=2921681 RepID=UPI0030FB2FAA